MIVKEKYVKGMVAFGFGVTWQDGKRLLSIMLFKWVVHIGRTPKLTPQEIKAFAKAEKITQQRQNRRARKRRG